MFSFVLITVSFTRIHVGMSVPYVTSFTALASLSDVINFLTYFLMTSNKLLFNYFLNFTI